MKLLFLLITCVVRVKTDVCVAGTCTQVTTVPIPCPVHTTTVQGATGLQQCVCAPGAYGNRTGVPCDLCEPGKFSNTTLAPKCTDCPHGTFMDRPGASVCWDCALGVIANVTAAQNDSFCVEPRYVVQLVVSRMTLTDKEITQVIALLAVALGLPASQWNRISILSARRRNLLSTGTTTFKIVAKTQEEANYFANLLTYQFLLNNVFRNSTVTPPIAIISVEVIDLQPPPPPTPTPTDASVPVLWIGVGTGVGAGLLLSAGVIAYLWRTGKFKNLRTQADAYPTIRVRISTKMS